MERKDWDAARHTGGWIVLAGAFLLACYAFSQPAPPPTSLSSGREIELGIDINTADEAELACIPGVGPSLARRIIEYRQAHGPFETLEELEQVPGVGPAKAAQLAEALLPLEQAHSRIASQPALPVSSSIGRTHD